MRNRRYQQLTKEGYLITVSTIRQYPFLHNSIKNVENIIATTADVEIVKRNRKKLILLQMKIMAVEGALGGFSVPDRMIIESRFFERIDINRIDGGSVNTIYRLCKRFVLKVAELLGEE